MRKIALLALAMTCVSAPAFAQTMQQRNAPNPVGGVPSNPVGGVPSNPVGGVPSNPVGGVPSNPVGGVPSNPVGGVPNPIDVPNPMAPHAIGHPIGHPIGVVPNPNAGDENSPD